MGSWTTRESEQISTLEWTKLREDTSYRVFAYEAVVPTWYEVMTISEDVQQPGALFTTGVRHGDRHFDTVAEFATEAEAQDGHSHFVEEIRTHGPRYVAAEKLRHRMRPTPHL